MFEQRAVDAFVHQLRTRLFVLRLRLHEIDARNDAGIDLVLRDLHRSQVGGDRRLVEALAVVGDAQRRIIRHEIGLGREPRVGEVGVARLCRRRIALDLAAQRAPQVEFPIEGEAGRVLADRRIVSRHRRRAAGSRGAAQAARAGLLPRSGAREVGIERRLILPDDRARPAIVGLEDLEVLVRHVDLRRETVERRIVVDPPPLAAIRAVGGLGRTEHRCRARRKLGFLVGGRNRAGRRRALVVGPDEATRNEQKWKKRRSAKPHAGAPARPMTRATRLGWSRSRRRKRSR